MKENLLHRQYDDPQEHLFDNPILLDKHRIIHSTAFRRLGYKTQVFIPFDADHFRTRLTHSIEVSHIARIIARKFKANELLSETISLAHDLGHSPFGHAGEHILNELLRDEGGFEHNRQSIRVVQYLERPYPWFVGLNLTNATIAGLKLHNTPYDNPDIINSRNAMLEAQIANWSDRIAYDASDIEDAFGAGIIKHEDMLDIELYNCVWKELAPSIKNMPIYKIRRIICEHLQMKIIKAIELTDSGMLIISSNTEKQIAQMEKFMLENVYLHKTQKRIGRIIEDIIRKLFERYLSEPELLPKRYLERQNVDNISRIIADYISGMTDRYCIKVYRRLFGDDLALKELYANGLCE